MRTHVNSYYDHIHRFSFRVSILCLLACVCVLYFVQLIYLCCFVCVGFCILSTSNEECLRNDLFSLEWDVKLKS